MSEPALTPVKPPVFPRSMLLGAGALMLVTIGLAGTARITNHNHVVLAPTYAVASRDLSFKDMADGGVDISDADTGKPITTVVPTTGGFLRGIVRGLVRDHHRYDAAVGYPFRLTRWADGRLSIEDPGTHERFELEAFGSTNEAVFARLLEDRPEVGGLTGTVTR